jgi:hypothetical protein
MLTVKESALLQGAGPGYKRESLVLHCEAARCRYTDALESGFEDVRVSYDLDRRLLFTLNYLKHGHSGRQFLITAIK